jgi:hypothetical protein
MDWKLEGRLSRDGVKEAQAEAIEAHYLSRLRELAAELEDRTEVATLRKHQRNLATAREEARVLADRVAELRRRVDELIASGDLEELGTAEQSLAQEMARQPIIERRCQALARLVEDAKNSLADLDSVILAAGRKIAGEVGRLLDAERQVLAERLGDALRPLVGLKGAENAILELINVPNPAGRLRMLSARTGFTLE